MILRGHSWQAQGTLCDAGDQTLTSACKANIVPTVLLLPSIIKLSLELTSVWINSLATRAYLFGEYPTCLLYFRNPRPSYLPTDYWHSSPQPIPPLPGRTRFSSWPSWKIILLRWEGWKMILVAGSAVLITAVWFELSSPLLLDIQKFLVPQHCPICHLSQCSS